MGAGTRPLGYSVATRRDLLDPAGCGRNCEKRVGASHMMSPP